MILGDFDLYAMRNVGEIIGPLFLFSYIYFVYFVLLNMFLAIINETYARIESDPTLETLKIKNFSLNFYRFIPRKKSIDYETNLKVNDNFLTVQSSCFLYFLKRVMVIQMTILGKLFRNMIQIKMEI